MVHVLHLGEFQFSGEKEKPTIFPAVIWPRSHKQEHHCVYTITDGRIYFGKECSHLFAGSTVALPEWEITHAGIPNLPRTFAG
jgi:hypothetical protein